MKIRISLDTIKKAGYPPKHRIWDVFKGEDGSMKPEVVVDANFRSFYQLASGVCLLSSQAKMVHK